MQSPWEGARHGILSRGEGLGVVRSTRPEGQLTARAETWSLGLENLRNPTRLLLPFTRNYWPVGLVVIRMEKGFFSRNYCRVGLVVIRMEERYYCVV